MDSTLAKRCECGYCQQCCIHSRDAKVRLWAMTCSRTSRSVIWGSTW